MPTRLLAAAVAAHAAAPPPPPPPPQSCAVAEVATAEIDTAFRMAVQPVAPVLPPQPRRWSVLLPVRVWLGGHDGVRAGLAWTETQAGLDGRWTQFADRAVNLRVEWDLRDLARDPLPAPRPSAQQQLELALRAEQLAGRLAEPLRHLRKAQAAARALVDGDPLCSAAQADAEAAVFVLRAVAAAVRAGRSAATGSAALGPGAPPAPPTADPE
ncbi:MAG: hypothetical protein HY902_10455 [Deltaproteobacteria bacterium]|nr:hypothetical protein [Deltaproteobacteria bacterium]